jgi:hypothetical protein
MERFRAEGEGVGRVFLGVLDLPENDAEVGDTSLDLPLGLVAVGDMAAAEGKSYSNVCESLSPCMMDVGPEDA